LIRGKLIELFDKIIKKNEICLTKAREKGMEKVLSRILALRKRMDRIKKEMERTPADVHYKFEKMPQVDESTAGEIDLVLEKSILQTSEIIDALTCMETDMHICDHYALMEERLREIEKLFRSRALLFRKMRIFG
jgi:hypothetical protein